MAMIGGVDKAGSPDQLQADYITLCVAIEFTSHNDRRDPSLKMKSPGIISGDAVSIDFCQMLSPFLPYRSTMPSLT